MKNLRIFDYKGFRNKSGFYLNKAKQIVGKGESDDEVWKRRLQVVKYYEDNPDKTTDIGKSESKESYISKLDKSKSKIVTHRINKLDKEIKATGSKFDRNKTSKVTAVVTGALLAAPIPGTTAMAVVPYMAEKGYKKYKLNKLAKKSPGVKKSISKWKSIRTEIKKKEKAQAKKGKRLRKLIGKRR